MQFKNKTLLVIAPHPDDEVLGCGGLINRIKDEGGKVYVMFLTVGNTKDFSSKGKSTTKQREKEIEKVAKLLRFNNYQIMFKGNKHHLKLDLLGQKDVMQIIERKSRVSVEKVKPDIVVFPSQYSYNQDHQLAAKATHAALRPAEGGKHFVEYAWAYEMNADQWSLHQQVVNNIFVSLKNHDVQAKIKAMQLYASQVRPFPNPRSNEVIKMLARLRGTLASSEYAEGFIGFRMKF